MYSILSTVAYVVGAIVFVPAMYQKSHGHVTVLTVNANTKKCYRQVLQNRVLAFAAKTKSTTLPFFCTRVSKKGDTVHIFFDLAFAAKIIV